MLPVPLQWWKLVKIYRVTHKYARYFKIVYFEPPYNIIWHGMIWYDICDMIIYDMIRYDMTWHGPLVRYTKLQVAHAPGMLGTFFPPPLISDPDMHHGTCVTHVPWCMPGSLTCGFIWSRWRGKRSRHSRCMRNSQFYVSVKRSMAWYGIREQKPSP